MDSAAAVAPPAVVSAVDESGDAVEQARTLIGALNLLSRNLPLPPDVLRAVSSIYNDGGAGDPEEEAEGERDVEMAVVGTAGEGCTEGTADGAAEVRPCGSSGLCGDFPFLSSAPGAVCWILLRVCGIRRDEVWLGLFINWVKHWFALGGWFDSSSFLQSN